VTKGAVDHLIDARRQQPSTRRIPEPPEHFKADDVSLASHGGLGATSGDADRAPSQSQGPRADPAASGSSQTDTSPGDTSDPETPSASDDRQITLDF
jgi:hypothetical protein